MPAKDIIHNAVKNAIIKDGWIITADPYELSYQEVSLAIDLAAEKMFEAARGPERILVEAKSFVGHSFARDFQLALGQYEMYRGILEVLRVPDVLYLAISDFVYHRFFRKDVYTMLVERFRVNLLVVDIETEDIVSWIN